MLGAEGKSRIDGPGVQKRALASGHHGRFGLSSLQSPRCLLGDFTAMSLYLLISVAGEFWSKAAANSAKLREAGRLVGFAK